MKLQTLTSSIYILIFLILSGCSQGPGNPQLPLGNASNAVSGYSQQDMLNSVFFSDKPITGLWSQYLAMQQPGLTRTAICKDVKSVRVDATSQWTQSGNSDLIADDHCTGAFGTELSILYTQNPNPSHYFSNVELQAIDLRLPPQQRTMKTIFNGETTPIFMGAFPPIDKVITASHEGDVIAFVVENETDENGIKVMKLDTTQGATFGNVLDEWLVPIGAVTWWKNLSTIFGSSIDEPNPTSLTLTPDGKELYFSVIMDTPYNILVKWYRHTIATKQTDLLFEVSQTMQVVPVRMYYVEKNHELAWNTEIDMFTLDVQHPNLILNPNNVTHMGNNIGLVNPWGNLTGTPFFVNSANQTLVDINPHETFFSNNLDYLIGGSHYANPNNPQQFMADQYIEVMNLNPSQSFSLFYEIYHGPITIGLMEVIN